MTEAQGTQLILLVQEIKPVILYGYTLLATLTGVCLALIVSHTWKG